MLFFGEGQLREKGSVFSSGEGEDLRNTKSEKVVTLFTWVLFAIYREVKVGGLCRISMWDFVQVAVVVTRVLEIRFDSLRASAIGSFGKCLAPLKSVFLLFG
ncbi:unnamed protein product, partial [Prunus brigantina]